MRFNFILTAILAGSLSGNAVSATAFQYKQQVRTLVVTEPILATTLEWSTPLYDFGALDIRSPLPLSGDILLLNSGLITADIAIATTSQGGVFSPVTSCTSTLASGSTCKTKLGVSFVGALGLNEGTLSVTSYKASPKSVAIRATLYDSYQTQAIIDGVGFEYSNQAITAIDFGLNSTVSSKTLKIKNTNSSPALVNINSLTGAFTIDSQQSTCVSTQILAAGASCDLQVVYTPTTGSDYQTLTISNNAGSKTLGLQGQKGYVSATTNSVSPAVTVSKNSVAITATGTNYSAIAGVQYSVNSNGWTAGLISAKTDTSMTFSIDATTTGVYSFRLLNADNTVNSTMASTTTVMPAMTVTTATPTKVYLSNTTAPYDFSLVGVGFAANDALTLDLNGSATVVGTDNLASSTSRSIRFASLPSTNSNVLTLKVVSALDAQRTASKSITIVGVATVSSISPTSAATASSVPVTINGTNLLGTIPQYRLTSGSWTAPISISAQTSTAITMNINASTGGTYEFRLLNDDNSVNYTLPQTMATVTTGDAVFTTPGTYSWTAPAGVTSVSAVTVGGGGGGQNNGYAGAGGALAYLNNIAVVPGTSYTVVVGGGGPNLTGNPSGTSGGDSYFMNCSKVCAGGATRTINNTAPGGVVKAGNGGAGGASAGSRGGGAGGYSGTGGSGTTAGSGGAGGSGYNSTAGGGVGLYGEGATGANGIAGNTGGKGGSGGSNGGTSGGNYGGGGSGSGYGGGGAVRIIWGTGRSFPNNAN